VGFCIGGHLGLPVLPSKPDVRATVCYYATGHPRRQAQAGTPMPDPCSRKEIRGELLMIFGTTTRTFPDAARETIDRALQLRCPL